MILSLRSRCTFEVAMKVWIRGCSASSIASAARSMSPGRVRARAAITGLRTSRAIVLTARKSSGELIGKPASMTSTPSSSRACANRSFSAGVMLAPGDCSPSLRVVSKMMTRLSIASSHAPSSDSDASPAWSRVHREKKNGLLNVERARSLLPSCLVELRWSDPAHQRTLSPDYDSKEHEPEKGEI